MQTEVRTHVLMTVPVELLAPNTPSPKKRRLQEPDARLSLTQLRTATRLLELPLLRPGSRKDNCLRHRFAISRCIGRGDTTRP